MTYDPEEDERQRREACRRIADDYARIYGGDVDEDEPFITRAGGWIAALLLVAGVLLLANTALEAVIKYRADTEHLMEGERQ